MVRNASEISRPWWTSNFEKDGILVEMKQDLTEGCFVAGKESEFFEVLVNFIKNAAEAMPNGGTIRISTDIMEDQAVLEVQDSGVGIPEAHLERIFDPFWTTKGTMGTGLGLAATHGILSSHGGTISVASKVGEGTTFCVKLPLARKVHEGVCSTLEPIGQLNLRILVIDDTELILTLLEALLTRHQHTVFAASSGMQGLELHMNNDVDLVLCDLGMPGMSGWEVGSGVKLLCEGKGIRKTPFILLTGWDRQTLDPDRIAQSGIDGVLEKPVNIKELFEMIQKVASNVS